ncbi:MAG: hypothetical protein OXR64_10505 [Chloroflexota bacterium]|nr:hypothetical protein [Chloroflexota bacterium]MDE2920261.1 hypothetical protein [Chloroflexota bacterium]
MLIGENPLLVARLWDLMYRGTAPMGDVARSSPL